jgi:hypothetical protein
MSMLHSIDTKAEASAGEDPCAAIHGVTADYVGCRVAFNTTRIAALQAEIAKAASGMTADADLARQSQTEQAGPRTRQC